MLVALQPRLPWACVLVVAVSLATGCERRPATPEPRTLVTPVVAPAAAAAAVAGAPTASEVAAGDRPPGGR